MWLPYNAAPEHLTVLNKVVEPTTGLAVATTQKVHERRTYSIKPKTGRKGSSCYARAEAEAEAAKANERQRLRTQRPPKLRDSPTSNKKQKVNSPKWLE
jgi:hypothetical protein